MFALFLEFRARTRPQDLCFFFFILETVLKFLIWTQGEIGPDNWASSVNPCSCEETLSLSGLEGFTTALFSQPRISVPIGVYLNC